MDSHGCDSKRKGYRNSANFENDRIFISTGGSAMKSNTLHNTQYQNYRGKLTIGMNPDWCDRQFNGIVDQVRIVHEGKGIPPYRTHKKY